MDCSGALLQCAHSCAARPSGMPPSDSAAASHGLTHAHWLMPPLSSLQRVVRPAIQRLAHPARLACSSSSGASSCPSISVHSARMGHAGRGWLGSPAPKQGPQT